MTAVVQKAPGESVEWVNMCFRKIWRVYQRGLERWITDLLQPVFDGLISVSVNIQYMANWIDIGGCYGFEHDGVLCSLWEVGWV